ncbi:tRNA intron endonuclease [Cokeromyces recurvatus]|uniref:tRNA intron endonuclease n=1 Tax=Cokeromyces recurvatus TaxID=90255 RepID=UPI0022211ECC|nr:tRNA intron endonuclease [Cokeromyces recurvatus]KAI7900937.1 tRNA intron endonuclease [Cokeromyces recurvatus]
MINEEKDLIQIKQFGNKYFIFNAHDVKKLRCEYRIVGALNGTLPSFPSQNTFFGLPLILLQEEVELLLKKGWATLITSSRSLPPTSTSSRAIIFDHFWSMGFYLTNGIKFGGDFVLYSNDPMCVHSDYIVSVKEPKEIILPIDIIAAGRVATNVKKIFVFASVVDEDQVFSYSIEWAGF